MGRFRRARYRQAHLLRLIIEIYDDSTEKIKKSTQMSPPFRVTQGLRQGCSMSSILFNLYVLAALTKWKKQCRGLGIPVGDDTLFSLIFAADYQVVLAQDSFNLEFMLKKIYEYQNWDLQMSLHKKGITSCKHQCQHTYK